MRPESVNLAERFGDRYRITWDEAYDPSHVPAGKRDPWMMQIVGQRGTVYPHGGELLAVEVDGHPHVARALLSLDGTTLHQDGTTEKTILFPVALFEQVAAIVHPRKRRRLTDEQRQALVERGAGFRFRHGVQGEFPESQAAPAVEDGSRAG